MALGMPSSSSCREISIACDFFFLREKNKCQLNYKSEQFQLNILFFVGQKMFLFFGGNVVIANKRRSMSCFIKPLTYSETISHVNQVMFTNLAIVWGPTL